ncbi:MAG: Rha family transcriptional regulator [Methylobacter sp.]
MNTQVTPEFRSYVEVIHGQIKTTSIKVAEHFGKRHDNVIRAIESLECSAEFHALNFEEMEIDIEIGLGKTRKSTAYKITKDGFVFLITGKMERSLY